MTIHFFKISFRNHLIIVVKKLKSAIVRSIFCCGIPLTRKFHITYFADSKDVQDSIGAQIHRIIALISIAKALRISYVHTAIQDFTSSPTDSAQTAFERKIYCNEVDTLFDNSPKIGTADSITYKSIEVDKFRIGILFKLILLEAFNDRKVLIKIKLPFPLIDENPDWYKYFVPYYPQSFLKKYTNNKKAPVLAVHFRFGANFASNNALSIASTQKRVLPVNYYLKTVREIIAKDFPNSNGNLVIKIFTDSPKVALTYFPPKEQLHLYRESGFDLIQESIHIIPFNFEQHDFKSLPNLEVVHGGDLLEALYEMASADYFVMSRSSLSYCSAILNKIGKVYYPPNYWHAPLPKWKRLYANSSLL